MERKHFLAAAVAAAATAAAAVAAMAATTAPNATPLPAFSPAPGRSPHPGSSIHPSIQHFHHRHTTGGATDLEHIHRHLERLIDMVEQYESTGAHIPQAIGYLQQADTEIIAALSEASPSPAL